MDVYDKRSYNFNNFYQSKDDLKKPNHFNPIIEKGKASNKQNLSKSKNSEERNKNKKEDKNYKIICPKCNEKIQINKKKKNPITISEEVKCVKCKNKVYVIECFQCKKEIYLGNMFSELLLGISIKCPYVECEELFSYISCGSCKKFIGIKGNYCESSNVKCPYEDCGVVFYSVSCPYSYCHNSNTFPDNKYFEGINIKCTQDSCSKEFSKFSCSSCGNKFYLDENDSNNFYEGKDIICPLETCKKIYNKFHCPSCFQTNIFQKDQLENSNMKNYNFIKCKNHKCGMDFIKIACPKCLSVNEYMGRNNLEGKKIICSNENCKYGFYFYNCLECKHLNFWQDDENKYIRGQEVICQNDKCKSISRKIACPFCFQNKIFCKNTLQEFSYGKNLECQNEFCAKKFNIVFCPDCKVTKINKNHIKNILTTFKCPINYDNYNDFSLLIKPCRNICFMDCPKCLTNFYLYENEIIEKNPSESLLIVCPNEKCKQEFSILEKTKINLDATQDEKKNGKIISGHKIDFVQGKIYEKYSKVSNFKIIDINHVFLDTMVMLEKDYRHIYKNPLQNNNLNFEEKVEDEEISKFCQICCEFEKNRIFAPCGHLSCNNCIEKLNDKTKCPNCKTEIKSIVIFPIQDKKPKN